MEVKSQYIKRIIGIAILLVIFGIIYFLFSPEESQFFPKCVFHTLTGWDCPGCGSQRAAHHLLHLEIKKAFLSNPLLMIGFPYIIIAVYFEYFGGKERFPKTRKILFGKNAITIIFILIILFWIGRNII